MTAESIGTALDSVKEIASWVLTFVSENPVLMVFFVAGMIPVGVKVVKSIIRAVRK